MSLSPRGVTDNVRRARGRDLPGGQLKLQGEAAGMVIEMYVNTTTKKIETAYPVRRDRR